MGLGCTQGRTCVKGLPRSVLPVPLQLVSGKGCCPGPLPLRMLSTEGTVQLTAPLCPRPPLSQMSMGLRGSFSPAKYSSRSTVWDLQLPRGWLRPPCPRSLWVPVLWPCWEAPQLQLLPCVGGTGVPISFCSPRELQSALGTGAWCSPSPFTSWAAPLCSWPPWLGLEVRETGRSALLTALLFLISAPLLADPFAFLCGGR